jgi:hypothetical protein
MTAYTDKKSQVIAALYPVQPQLRSLGISLHPHKFYTDFLTLCIGCDPDLDAETRDLNWRLSCPIVLSALERAGLTVVDGIWPLDGRTYAIAY